MLKIPLIHLNNYNLSLFKRLKKIKGNKKMKKASKINEDYWKTYMVNWFGKDYVYKWEKYGSEIWIPSNGEKIHLDVYDTENPEANTIIFSHGIAGYARLLIPFLIPLFQRGYNIIAPDLKGYGFNEGRKGDFQWDDHLLNLYDAVLYAKNRFKGKIIIGGASMGGPLAYAMAARYQNVDALICWCLFDFQNKEFVRKNSKFGNLTYLLLPFLKFLKRFMGKVRIRAENIISYEDLANEDLVEYLREDPLAGNRISIRATISLITQSVPDISYNSWNLPSLVIQPGSDRMTLPSFTKDVYNQLGALNKRYIELEGAIHFPTEDKYYQIWADEVDQFLQELNF